MLKPQDVDIQVMRMAKGRDCIKVTHKPTGIFRFLKPPILKPGRETHQAKKEIEAELIERGLTQHLLRRPLRRT